MCFQAFGQNDSVPDRCTLTTTPLVSRTLPPLHSFLLLLSFRPSSLTTTSEGISGSFSSGKRRPRPHANGQRGTQRRVDKAHPSLGGWWQNETHLSPYGALSPQPPPFRKCHARDRDKGRPELPIALNLRPKAMYFLFPLSIETLTEAFLSTQLFPGDAGLSSYRLAFPSVSFRRQTFTRAPKTEALRRDPTRGSGSNSSDRNTTKGGRQPQHHRQFVDGGSTASGDRRRTRRRVTLGDDCQVPTV